MKVGNIKLLNYCHYIFFFLFLLIGLNIYKDYGFNIDETFQRRSGLYWLNYLAEVFKIDSLSNVTSEKLKVINDFTMPWAEKDKAYSIIFDVPAALLEIFLNLREPIEFYQLRHLLTFLYFFIGTVFFYKLLMNRFGNRFISLLGCLLLIITPRLFGEIFHNNKDIIFLSFFIIACYYYFQTIDNEKIKSILFFSFFSAICTSLRFFGFVFPILFLSIYLLSSLSKKEDIIKINQIFIYLFFYIVFLILHWPYLWSDPFQNLVNHFSNLSIFGSPVIYFNGEFYNTKFLPYYYLPLWILISTPVLNIVLFLSGFFIVSKKLIFKLLDVEKNTSNYDFWDNNDEKKDFFITLLFLVFFIGGTFFSVKHYNSWRVFYFLNFFIIYFSIYFINYQFLLKTKKYLKIFTSIIIVMAVFNLTKLITYHPYQSLYFSTLTTKQFKNKFEIDFTGLSGIEFLREIVNVNSKSKIYIGVNSWYPLWRMKELLPEFDKKRIIFVFDDINKADYVYSNKIFNVNIKKSNKFKLNENFKIYKQRIIDDLIIYEVHKKLK